MTDYCIKTIRIWRYSTRDPFACKIDLDYDDNALVIQIPPERVAEIVNVIADLIVGATRDVALQLNSAALEQTAIEHKPESTVPDSFLKKESDDAET